MSAGFLNKRVAQLEQKTGGGKPPVCIAVCFINPEREEYLTPKEKAALDAYQEALFARAGKGDVVIVLRTKEKAQELLASP
jgi:hypothetical protein